MTRTRTAALLVTVAAALALSAACGKGAAPAPAAGAPADTVRLVAATVGNLGTVVTDRNGYTVYLFTKDTTDPSVSTCTGSCAAMWPPLLAGTGEVELDGIDRALVGTVKRTDGTEQLTINKRPLYRYAKDAAPGEARGQGVSGAWFAATPDGRTATASAESTDTGYGY